MSKQQSAFKQLYSELFNQGGDFSKVSKDMKKPLKCYVKESYPFFLVTDGYFFLQLYFTKEAVAEFKKNFPNVNIVDLHDRVIMLSKWTIELGKVNSNEVFTSYSNLEARMIVHSFSVNLNERLNPTRYPINLYRDDEMKTLIQHFRHSAVQTAVNKATKNESLPDISKCVGVDKKAKVDQGIVKASNSKGDEFAEFSFKEGSSPFMKLKEIYIQEKGKDALKKIESEGAPTVKGAKGKKKALDKSKKGVKGSIDKVLKYTPNKPGSKKETPQKAGGKLKKSTTGGKKASNTPGLPSPGGAKTNPNTGEAMTVEQL